MYEFRAGTARLINALESAAADPERLQSLADVLYYYPDQLKQDIDAAGDLYSAFHDQQAPEIGGSSPV